MRWMIRAETHQGAIIVLRSGFETEDEALDFPVKLKFWARVWVEPQAQHVPQRERAALPSRP